MGAGIISILFASSSRQCQSNIRTLIKSKIIFGDFPKMGAYYLYLLLSANVSSEKKYDCVSRGNIRS